jgi:hypothetical protein
VFTKDMQMASEPDLVKRWDSPSCKICRVSRARPSRAVLSRDERTGERKERRVMEGKHQFLDKGHVPEVTSPVCDSKNRVVCCLD